VAVVAVAGEESSQHHNQAGWLAVCVCVCVLYGG
jgi:hypothetical protein